MQLVVAAVQVVNGLCDMASAVPQKADLDGCWLDRGSPPPDHHQPPFAAVAEVVARLDGPVHLWQRGACYSPMSAGLFPGKLVMLWRK